MTAPETGELSADCAHCFALCCVALPFARSADFAIDKDGGTPCRNLLDDFRCGIHAGLRESGFAGCTVYECFGAGQKVSQGTFGGRSWRAAPDTAPQMFDVFPVVRQLHEMLWYLAEARSLSQTRSIHGDLTGMYRETAELADGSADDLVALDVGAHRERVNALLLQTSELVRATVAGRRKDRRGADLMGAKLVGADLKGTNLRGAYLIGADLRRADLRAADVIGADFRGADVRGAGLAGALFLTQFQINAAKGDAATTLPSALTRPAHW
ncbi:pentapeptide repeat-containing protein [Rhodococcus sp. ABRD24]|uniref:pentapeptide repeat-containing protein n=1 Tax=Rhodococcus sp. ABRD24 TaxID=2507582 RepID=UPI00103DF020|nr:pentapeptide repeat-containing protein [Rhodococcus sp. ABRD24]QBJ98281.1 pentapeptide repeat-containing protein [Rhodococcus sp. ABRD24]